MNRAIATRAAGFLLTLGFVFIVIYQGFGSHREESYQISMTGIFVLVDQKALLKRINDLSEIVGNRQLFLNRLEKLLTSEPYIQSSTVRYTWPNEVIIDIQEIVPKVLIRGHGFLSSDCMIIGYKDTNFENVHFFDLEKSDLNEFICQQVIQIQPYLTSEIKLITLLSNGDYRLIINDIIYVINNDLDKMFTKVWSIHHGLRRKGLVSSLIVDLRYLSGFTIKSVATLSIP